MTEIRNERDFEICPNCNTDLTEGNLMFVEVNCTNYIFYKKHPNKGWIINDETNGENREDGYYACRECEQKLPDEYQEYYGDNI